MLNNNESKVNKILSLAANYKRKNSSADWGEFLGDQWGTPPKQIIDIIIDYHFTPNEYKHILPKLLKLFDYPDVKSVILTLDINWDANLDECKDEIEKRVEQSKKDKQ